MYAFSIILNSKWSLTMTEASRTSGHIDPKFD